MNFPVLHEEIQLFLLGNSWKNVGKACKALWMKYKGVFQKKCRGKCGNHEVHLLKFTEVCIEMAHECDFVEDISYFFLYFVFNFLWCEELNVNVLKWHHKRGIIQYQ